MMKKLLSCICCLLPFGAGAVTVTTYPETGSFGDSDTWGSNGALHEVTVDDDNVVVVNGGKGVIITKDPDDTSATGGLSVSKDLIIGAPNTGDQGGDLFANVNNGFSIQSEGNVSVGALLRVVAGHALSIDSYTGDQIDVSVGSIDAASALSVGYTASESAPARIGNFTSGNITSTATVPDTTGHVLYIKAQNINAGAIDIQGTGASTKTYINAVDELNMTQFKSAGATTTIKATSVESGNIENSGGAMEITLTGNLDTINKTAISNSQNIGSIENIGTSMTINAKAVNVAGTLKNDTPAGNGTLTMNVDSLTVTGGDTTTNRSLVNKGNLYLTVAGATDFKYGVDLSGMQTTNEFSLTTGTLSFNGLDSASVAAGDAWLQVFSNNLNKFYLEITGGNVNAQSGIVNGASNVNADMTVIGKFVNATSVTNSGTLNLSATGTGTATVYALDISGAVQSNAGADTSIISSSNLNIAGNISNAGKMVINASDVNLTDSTTGVSNTGTSLEIKSGTDASGSVKIASGLTNGEAGSTNSNVTLTVESRKIDIDGMVTNYNGTTSIKGSDNGPIVGGNDIVAGIELGGIDVEGGQIKLEALAGDVSVDKTIYVNGGALNIAGDTHNLTAGQEIVIGGNVNLQGTLPITGNGDLNIIGTGTGLHLTSANSTITIDGNVNAFDTTSRTAQFDAKTITVGNSDNPGNVTAQNNGILIFGSDGRVSNTVIKGIAKASNGGKLDFYSTNTSVGTLTSDGGLVVSHGGLITATTGGININSGKLIFNPAANEESTTGLWVRDTDALTMATDVGDIIVNADVIINANSDADKTNTLILNSARDVKITKTVTADAALSVVAKQNAQFSQNITINNTGSLTVDAPNIVTDDIDNTGTVILGLANNVAQTVTTGDIDNAGNTTINAKNVTTDNIGATDGVLTVKTVADRDSDDNVLPGTDVLVAKSITASNNGIIELDAGTITVNNDINANVGTAFVQGSAGNSVGINLVRDNAKVLARNMNVGAFNAVDTSVTYDLSGSVAVTGAFAVDNAANVIMTVAKGMTGGSLSNDGALTLMVNGADGLKINGDIENTGDLTLLLNTSTGYVTAQRFVVNTGTTNLTGRGMTLSGAFGAEDMPANTSSLSMLYHGVDPELTSNYFRIVNADYTLGASSVVLAGIEQANTNRLTINTSDLKIANDIDVVDMRVAANPSTNWLQVDVGGNVVGGAQFIGLKSMHIGGNYRFTNNSQINAAILQYPNDPDSKINNYWSTISLIDDSTLGQITNADNGAALIQVDGAFESTADMFAIVTNNSPLARPQIGLVLNDVVDPGTAIWLLHADGGLVDTDLTAKIRNLSVSFCNADGSICFDYLGALKEYNGTDPKADLPAYVSVRDSAGDGFADSLYIVFDPRFGGPVEVFKIQPIVGRVDDHTAGEYGVAGALDDLIAAQLANKGFRNRTPIQAIPLVFKGTNMDVAANELYNRMEAYELGRDGTALARFSRLFQPREVEQLTGNVVLNEHTNFRSFEDRMFDEFIWNRHRSLKKAWLDIDYGMFFQNATDGKHADGNRVNVTGGFDWQESQTLLLGVTGRVSRTSSDILDSIDLGYIPGQYIAGRAKTTVSDTNIGLGAYLMKILGQKTRVYGNGFLDIHLLDVDREQNFVSKISGSGTVFSLMSEWGLLHDWLNQYVVGNMYARVGYTTGFDITEKAAGQDYMNMKSDGYFTFTPGYSLTAQKRIYPSVWFQIRPYATIGVEYDVLGAPDTVKYKFALANNYTTYDIDIDPLWANIGGGVEMLSVTGIQVGIDYRYQYNSDMQLHNIRLSGSYRF